MQNKTNVSLNRHLEATPKRLHALSPKLGVSQPYPTGWSFPRSTVKFSLHGYRIITWTELCETLCNATLQYINHLTYSNLMLQIYKKYFKKENYFATFLYFFGGGRGIRTPGPFRVGTLAVCWFKPLTHPSIRYLTFHYPVQL